MEIATTDINRLLSRECDGIIVASAHEAHARHSRAALEAGAHLLIEKPMAITLQEALGVSEAATTSGRTVSIAHGWNYSKLATWASGMADGGKMGEVKWLSGHMATPLFDTLRGRRGYGAVVHAGVRFEAAPGWRIAAGLRGGYLYGAMSHQLALALMLLRERPAEVFARATRLSNGVDIDVHVSVVFAGGQIGVFGGHGRLPEGVKYALGLRMAAEGGVLTLDFERERADMVLRPDSVRELDPPREGRLAPSGVELSLADGDGAYSCDGPANFLIDACLGRPAVNRAPLELGVRTVAILDAAVRSIETGAPVRVEEFS